MVTDPAKKRALADIYRENFAEYAKFAQSNSYEEGDLRAEQREKVTESAVYLTENFHRVPVLMIPCITGNLDRVPAFQGASAWGSLLPAVWSFMLAARERGLGTAWTTIHLMRGGDQKAAELLGIPHPDVTQAGLFPIAYTIGTDFRPAKRLPLDPILHWNEW
jgi:nitroreductase